MMTVNYCSRTHLGLDEIVKLLNAAFSLHYSLRLFLAPVAVYVVSPLTMSRYGKLQFVGYKIIEYQCVDQNGAYLGRNKSELPIATEARPGACALLINERSFFN